MQAGDVLFVQGEGLGDMAIRAAQSLRPSLRPTARFTHCALITSSTGDLIEAVHTGVRKSQVCAYADHETCIVPITATPADRVEIVAFAESLVGREYGMLDIISIGLALMTGCALNLTTDNAYICSDAVASALCRGQYIFPHSTSALCPAELARLLGVS